MDRYLHSMTGDLLPNLSKYSASNRCFLIVTMCISLLCHGYNSQANTYVTYVTYTHDNTFLDTYRQIRIIYCIIPWSMIVEMKTLRVSCAGPLKANTLLKTLLLKDRFITDV